MNTEIMNEQNLIPNSKRTPEQLREMGRKGGIKSGEARRKKRDQVKRAKMIAEIILENAEIKNALKELTDFFQN